MNFPFRTLSGITLTVNERQKWWCRVQAESPPCHNRTLPAPVKAGRTVEMMRSLACQWGICTDPGNDRPSQLGPVLDIKLACENTGMFRHGSPSASFSMLSNVLEFWSHSGARVELEWSHTIISV